MRSSDYLKIPSKLEPIEAAKRLAAHKAVDDHWSSDARVVGIGSGSTIVYAVERIIQKPGIDSMVFIPTGFQSKELIQGARLCLGSIEAHPVVDIAFDGADEVDDELNCIKGGGGCLYQEKLVAECAEKFIVVADERKQSSILGSAWTKGIPIEVEKLAYNKVLRELVVLGAQNPQLRQGGTAKAGPMVTDNGNFIIDAPFGHIRDPATLSMKIKSLVGVLEVGLFINLAEMAYFGTQSGQVVELRKRHAAH